MTGPCDAPGHARNAPQRRKHLALAGHDGYTPMML